MTLPQPPIRPQLGFIYSPPWRIQGVSVAGEETAIQVPELDVCFDIGRCPRIALTSNFVALSHGHMDHSAGLPYYFSQRQFQGMGVGTVICHPALEQPICSIMNAWVGLEHQRTQYNIIPLTHEAEHEIKNKIYLRAFSTAHTQSSLGYVVVERRSKLKTEFIDLPQEKLIALKKQGQQITRTLEIPLVCYTGDTMWGQHFDRPDVLNAQVLIAECTFTEPDHKKRALIGKHLHIDDVIKLIKRSQAKAIILTHLSRRTHVAAARAQLDQALDAHDKERVFLLMDNRTNRTRWLDMQNQQDPMIQPHEATHGVHTP